MTVTPIDENEALTYRARFPIFDRKNYLNSCSLGPLGAHSKAALQTYADEWEEFGAPAWWLSWMPRIDRARELFAQGIQAAPRNLTIHHSASSALSSIASSIEYTSRPKVVVSEIDFPTIAYQWLVKRDVEVVFARSADGITVPLEEYERLIDDRTAAVATSHIFYATGAIQDIAAIGRLAHARGALIIVDGYHALGIMPVDVAASAADFYIGGALKWVCGGPGLTFIYASDACLARQPGVTGWFAARDQFAFETTAFDPADSADRFQLGTPAVGTVYSTVPALELLVGVGPDRIYERVRRLTDRVASQADEIGLAVASPRQSIERGGVVMLRMEDPASAVEFLNGQNIVVDARPGKLRISPHYFNTFDDVDEVMEALRQFKAVAAAAR